MQPLHRLQRILHLQQRSHSQLATGTLGRRFFAAVVDLDLNTSSAGSSTAIQPSQPSQPSQPTLQVSSAGGLAYAPGALPPAPLVRVADVVVKGPMAEDTEGGARHANAVSALWSNIPQHVRASFQAPGTMDEVPRPAAPLLVDGVLQRAKALVASTGLAPASWGAAEAAPYYGGRIPLAPYKKGQTAAYNYPNILVPRELANRFPLDMYVDPVFQTSDPSQKLKMRGQTLFTRLQGKTTLLLVFSGQPLSGLWTGIRQWLDTVGEEFLQHRDAQVFKLHCEEGWFNRRTHQLTKFHLRRQVKEEELFTTLVYHGKWKWEYVHALHLYNKDLPVILLIDSLAYIRWHAVGLPSDDASKLFRQLSRQLAHEKKNYA